MLSVSNSKARYFNYIFLLKTLVIFSILDCIFQISLGGFVRVTSSGLGCPDWPLCYGQIIPPMNYHTLIEWGHRTSGAILGLSILLIVIVTFIAQRNNLLLVILSISTLILVSIVGGIGGAVVLTELEPSLRTLHLFLAQIIILFLGLCYISINVDNSENIFKNMKIDTYSIFTGLAALSIIITLLSGSYAVWKGAGTVCSSWPLCTPGSILPQSFLGWIHMTHRVFSIISSLIGVFACYMVLRAKFNILLSFLSVSALLIVLMQILLGASNPWTKFQIWARVAHLGASSVLWGLMAILFCLVLFEKFRARE